MQEITTNERKKVLETLTFKYSKSEEDLILFAQYSELSFGGMEVNVVDANTVEICHDGNPAYQGQDLQDRKHCVKRVGRTMDEAYLKNGRTITGPQLDSLYDTQLRDLLERKKIGARQLEPKKAYPNHTDEEGWSEYWIPTKEQLRTIQQRLS